MYGRALFHLIGWGGAGLALMTIFKPSQAELEDIKKYPKPEFSAALKAAALMSEPLYRQTPAQIQKKVQETLKEIELENAKRK